MAIEETLRIHDQATATLKSVSAEARTADRSLDGAASSAKGAEDAFGKTGSSAAKLAGAADLLDPRLGAVARGFADLADVGEVASAASGAAGVSLASVAAIAAPAAVAIGALAAVWAVLNAELEEAEAKAGASAERATAAQEAHEQWAGQLRQVSDEYAVLSGAIDKDTQQAARQEEQWRASRTATRALLEEQVKLHSGFADATAFGVAREQLAAYDAKTEEVASNIQDLADYRRTSAAEAIREAEATKAAAAAAKAEAEATKAEAEQKRALAEAERELKAAMAEDEQEIRDNLAARAEERKLTEAVMLQAAEAEMAATLAQIAAEKKLREERLQGAAAAATNAAGGPSSVMSAVSSAGPWGSIIASLVSIAGDFQGIGDQFNDFTINFNESMAQLPETLTENLGRWISTGTASVIEMMFSNIDAMVDPNMWYGVGEAIVEGFIEGFTTGRFVGEDGKVTGKSFGMGALDILSGGLSGNIDEYSRTGKLTGHDDGTTYIPSTGLYMLHQGEEVMPRDGGTERQRTRSRGGGSGWSRGPGGLQYTITLPDNDLADHLADMRRRGYGV